MKNEELFEKTLPPYLKNDLVALEEGIKNNSTVLDCLWCEVYGSINAALINDRVITEKEAAFLRKKYLGI